MSPKKNMWEWLDNNKEIFREMAQKIWENPEIGLKEHYATTLQTRVLEDDGFRVNTDIGNMPTAFMAEFGSGKPILGILGEYDALPGLSQEVSAKRRPITEGAAGHGCGHNLLSTAGVAAAMAIKRVLQESDIQGTIRYYGCPAEETLVGKVFMARDGVFDDLDACLTWHPKTSNNVRLATSLAMNSVKFKFKGIAAHAAAAPHMGRSALKAVELMNAGVNYMREHIIEQARIHYSITNGGAEPNVVPADASVWYFIRSPEIVEVEGLFKRLSKVAQGAAMMTETEVNWKFLAACYNFLPNKYLGNALLRNMKEVGPPRFTTEDREFAKELANTFPAEQKRSIMKTLNTPDDIVEQVLHEEVADIFDDGHLSPGSRDIGDVSWIVPLAQFTVAAWPVGTALHSWQATAASGSSIGYKAMDMAAKTLAGTLYDLYKDKALLESAFKEFKNRTKGKKYSFPLPEDALPPFDQFEH